MVKNKKLPLNLVKEAFNKTISKGERLLQVESFQDTFGPQRRKRKPTIGATDLDDMLNKATEGIEEYNPAADGDLTKHI